MLKLYIELLCLFFFPPRDLYGISIVKIIFIIQDDDFKFAIVNNICNFDLFVLQLQLLTDTTEEYQV